jgi:oligopeptide transport system substrate-binding protein
MRHRTAARTAAVFLALLLVAGACSDTELPPTSTSGSPGSPPSESPSQSGATEAPDTLGGDSGRLRSEELPPGVDSSAGPLFPDDSSVASVAVPAPSTLDPMRLSDRGSVLIARQIYEGLTRWDPRTEEVEPALAESWKVSDEGRRFRFTLRPDARYHDGSQVTAADVKYAFERIARKRNGSDLAYLLGPIEGFNEVNSLGDSPRLRGIKAPDRRTVVIELTRPHREFPTVLTHPALVPLKPIFVQQLGRFLRNPIGNGPYEMATAFEPGEEVVLSAAEDHWERPELEGIRFVPYEDAAMSWEPFISRELDIAEVPTGRVEVAAQEYGTTGFQPLLVSSYYGFNLKSQQLERPLVRRAINRAINRKALARGVYKGTLLPPRGIVPRGMPGFNENACGSLCEFTPRKARAMVRSLPERARDVTMQYTAQQPQRRIAKAIGADLRKVGFKVTLEGFPFRAYLRLLNENDQSMFRLGWIAEYPDPDVFLQSLFQSSAPDNHTGFSSRAVNRLLAKARTTKSDTERAKLYRRAEERILDRVPLAPLGSFVIHWVAQPDLDVPFDALGGFDAASIRVDEG